jgi:hypothetical protein
MKLALFCNLNLTEVYINLEKCVNIRQLNFMEIGLFEFIRAEGGVKFMKHLKGVRRSYKSWEPVNTRGFFLIG